MEPGWWPTKGIPMRSEYVGPAACANCHGDKAENQESTPMAHALESASSAVADQTLRGPLGFRVGPYNYEVARTAQTPLYSVNDGTRSLSAPLLWSFGSGAFGQTYIFEQNDNFYESRVSYYRALPGLDFTIGNPRSAPSSLDTALGRKLYPDEARRCFGCHSTAATTNNRFDAGQLIPGVTCEACHGPGAQHVAAMTLGAGVRTPSFIMNPDRLSAVDSVDFCGACHRTSVDAALSGATGMLTLRFPVSRLQRSRCWGTGDSRITCVACHDPHQPLIRDPAYYDSRCLSCHVRVGNLKPSLDHPGSACRAGQKGLCVNCHMPKYTLPEMHATFTDHKISIHREGQAFRD